MSTSATDSDREHMAGRYYVRDRIPTPEGPLTVEVRAAHSREDATVRLETEICGEWVDREVILDGWEGHR
jgi:hypothetical protein